MIRREVKDDQWNQIVSAFPFKNGKDGYTIPSLNLVIVPEKIQGEKEKKHGVVSSRAVAQILL